MINKAIFSVVFLLFAVNLNAQVTIGSDKTPMQGALLELSDGTTSSDDTNVNARKGIILPRVELKDMKTLTMGDTQILDEDNEWANHSGLLVYHVVGDKNVCIPAGIYIWGGRQWSRLGKRNKKPIYTLPVTNLAGLDQPNSYIVTEPSIVKIPIDKARAVWDGESWTTSSTDTPANTPLLPAKAFGNLSAELVWHDDPCQNVILNPKDLQIVDGYIEVWVGEGQGNAIIALKSDDEVVWSWHIWATDSPTEGAYAHTNAAGAKYTFMDRNLGAISATPQDINSLGLKYQWGRKEPFVFGSLNPSNNTWIATPKAIYSADSSVIKNNNLASGTSEQANLINAIAKPLSFVTSGSPSSDWYSKVTAQWNYRWGGIANKSVMDPCPQGWAVPSHSGPAAEDSPWSMPGVNASISTPSSYTANPFNKGYDFVDKANYKLGWYPSAYFISYSGFSSSTPVLNFNYQWTTDSSSSSSKGMRFYMEGIVVSHTYQRGNAFSVRCVKEE